MNQPGFLPEGQRNWHWREGAQASYTFCSNSMLRMENCYRPGFQKLPNVSKRSSSQRWHLTSLCLFLAQGIPHTASSLFHKVTPLPSLGRTASFAEQKTYRRLTFKPEEEISDLRGAIIFLRSTISDNTCQRIIVLKKKNSVWTKQKELSSHTADKGICSLCFTVLQK